MTAKALKIYVGGTVQGVGFRPFVYRIATEEGLCGFVRNGPTGVEIHVEGGGGFRRFLERLRRERPVHARLDEVRTEDTASLNLSAFTIDRTMEGESVVFAPPDLFLCAECAKEILSPKDRRYRYPFTNCTDCGPRYTIITGLPYDRAKTTMRDFVLCAACRSEYESPVDRRYHAEPNACGSCGPRIRFADGDNGREAGVHEAAAAMREGKVVALKGLGGFHLLCDPLHPRAVARLRELKARSRKPFALMVRDASVLEEFAAFDSDELRVLRSSQRPVTLLRKKREMEGVSPGIDTYGVMLPYTPLHFLLMQEIPLLVATSANLREGPILKSEEEGVRDLADCVLTHDREIAMRCDDSVVKVFRGKPLFLRRARGYVPDPLELKFVPKKSSVLAMGGELKNTVSIVKNGYLITSQYLGDMKDYRNTNYLDEILKHFARLYSFEPSIVACDLHPDFTTTRRAEKSGKPVVRVQHHVAHLFAVMAEHGLDPGGEYFGASFDGMGYGEDGRIWGGEFFLLQGGVPKERLHFRYVPQPGGNLASKEPWRMALAYVLDATGRIGKAGTMRDVPDAKLSAVATAKGINSPQTSSVGRLFDAVSALTGLAPPAIDFEAEAAMRLEAAADRDAKVPYRFRITESEIDVREMIREILESEEPAGVVAGRFHHTLACIVSESAARCREEHGTKQVLLGGGVFLNALLLEKCVAMLEERGFHIYYPVRFSPGDECISAGQALYAAWNGG